MARRLRFKSTVLSIAIAQTQTEQTSNPIITVLTTQWAFQNSVNSERSDEVSGSTDCATSAGFIGTSFPLNAVPSVEPARRNIRNQHARDDVARAPSRKPNLAKFVCPVHRRPTKSPRNLAKLGRGSGLFSPKQR